MFFEQLRLPEARYNIEVGSGAHGEQTGKMMAGIEKVLMKEKPHAALMQEEGCIMGVPRVILRNNTERPENPGSGCNMLAGAEPVRIVRCAR